jgi:hypothetical protein
MTIFSKIYIFNLKELINQVIIINSEFIIERAQCKRSSSTI